MMIIATTTVWAPGRHSVEFHLANLILATSETDANAGIGNIDCGWSPSLAASVDFWTRLELMINTLVWPFGMPHNQVSATILVLVHADPGFCVRIGSSRKDFRAVCKIGCVVKVAG